MAKQSRRIVRHLPLVLALSAAGYAMKSAVEYRAELNRVFDNTENMVEIPPEIMSEVRRGKMLVHWIDDHGKKHYKINEKTDWNPDWKNHLGSTSQK